MANIKVSEMTEATSFNDGDYTMIVQANQNKKIARENILGDIEDDISTINTNISSINTNIGDLTDLETEDKSSVVNSINELKSAEVYSTNEVKTNSIWIDGKPIYRKVHTATITGQVVGGEIDIYIKLTNVDKVINYFGCVYAEVPVTLPHFQSRVIKLNNSNIRLDFMNQNNNSTFIGKNFELVLEYTKTTD